MDFTRDASFLLLFFASPSLPQLSLTLPFISLGKDLLGPHSPVRINLFDVQSPVKPQLYQCWLPRSFSQRK